MSSNVIKLVAGALIAAVLLWMYGYVVVEAIEYTPSTENHPLPSANAFWVMQTIGALVSAVVAAELAVTGFGEVPAGRIFGLSQPAPSEESWARIMAVLYLLAWLGLGIAAVQSALLTNVASPIQPPPKPQSPAPPTELIDFAKAWIGLAIAAAYAYFGIRPKAA
jgi:hypothetical protein